MKKCPKCSSLKIWLSALRPQTLWASLAPILPVLCYSFATSHKSFPCSFPWLLSLCILASTACIQIATNLANDYLDAESGVDSAQRLGPSRLSASGVATPSQVRAACLGFVFLAVLFAIPLVFSGGLPILLIGLISLACIFWYSLGSCSLSHTGLADIFVFLFFGPIASAGTGFLLSGVWSKEYIFLGLAPGFLSLAIFVANNLRDKDTDAQAGKRTLVVRFGESFARWEYLLCLVFASVSVCLVSFFLHPPYFLSLLCLPLTLPALRIMQQAASAQDYPALLPASARLLAAFTLCSSLAMLLS